MVYGYKSIRRTFYVEEIRDRVYAVTFTPEARGNIDGMEVKGSPFSLRIGKDMKETKSARTEAFKATNRMSGRYKKLKEQREENRKSYTEKEVFIEKPVTPPRNKRGKHRASKDSRMIVQRYSPRNLLHVSGL